MNLFNRRPSRAAVIRSLREAEALWKPPAEKDNARLEPSVGEADAKGGFDRQKDTTHGASRASICNASGDLALEWVAP